jgi:hypothetical protein
MKNSFLKQVFFVFMALLLLVGPLNITPAYALDAPVPIAPDDGMVATAEDTPPIGIPEFKWTAVTGATNYRFQISATPGFSTTIVNETTVNTSYTPKVSFADGVYYWRVRVETPTPASAWSTERSFTKQWASFYNYPSLTSPDNMATVDFYDAPLFSWTSVMGAAKYKLQIYASPGGWATPTYTATTLTTTHQPANKLANGTYYWRVVPVDSGNRDGTPSEERVFTAGYNPIPTLLEPVNGATPTFTPTFRWTAVRGAQFYRLQYTTDPAFGTGITTVDTRNTSHTPVATLNNDVNYYWRVQAFSGSSISDWTPIYSFIKRWYIKPVLLTPTNGYQQVRFPFFSWTPVPGAAYYHVELSTNPNFSPLFDEGDTANTFWSSNKYDGADLTYYWRVTPVDGSDKPGRVSDTFSYRSIYSAVAPDLVYPPYYYIPNSFAGFPDVSVNPYEERTVAAPIFIWHRSLTPLDASPAGEVYAEAYRLQVSTTSTFSTIVWTVDTENTYAAPTAANPFNPAPNTDYYWRVRPLIGGVEVDNWSQVWRTRFDPSKALPATDSTAPVLIRPTNGFELAEATPLLEWFPMSGASAYDVQISRASDFTEVVDSATVTYPAYVPTQALAQRSLGDVDFGVYYWRVRKSPSGTWSETRRFQIAAQSQWASNRTLGTNQLQIGSDTNQGTESLGNASYNLTSLYAAQSSSRWYFGFNVPPSPSLNVTYALYLDIDHVENSGGATDPRGYSISTIAGYRPEYVIYVLQKSGAYSASEAFIQRWNGTSWDGEQDLDTVGGQVFYSGGYVEISLPNTVIGYQDTTGSYAVALLSLPATTGQPQDSVPSSPNIPGGALVSRFSNVTERMNTFTPPTNAGVDPTIFPTVLPFIWDYSIRTPVSGAFLKVYTDPLFTTQIADYDYKTTAGYWARAYQSPEEDLIGDNTYYWRVQPRYRVGTVLYAGAWSQGWRFERKGFVPQNLQTSVTFATPTFSWDIVEGAEYYTVQVDDDPNFGSTAINQTTRQTAFTPTTTLANGSYYWRVRAHRWDGVINAWSASQSFTLSLPVPSGLNHIPSGAVSRAPTLCWDPILVNAPSTSTPVLAAWKYRVQVSKDPAFTTVFDSVDTEQACWTPSKAYEDAQYYWRVAMIDGNARLGNYSPAATFTKQYLAPTLVSPASGARTPGPQSFVWTPVAGAAKYKFESAKNPTFAPTYETVTTENTRWMLTKKYDMNVTYYWRVAILDAEGKAGPFVGATMIVSDRVFEDVPPGYWAKDYIERLYNAGVTGGCATTPSLLYCPERTVTRAQMAIFLLKGMYGPDYAPPPVGSSTGFADVPTSYWAAAWIKQLAAEGITGGCGNGNFCPDNAVTRAQMAVFLLKAIYGSAYVPPPVGTTSGFLDVPITSPFAPWIKQLAAEGITGGCGGGNYCPSNAVNRAQMAVFLVKAFNLP